MFHIVFCLSIVTSRAELPRKQGLRLFPVTFFFFKPLLCRNPGPIHKGLRQNFDPLAYSQAGPSCRNPCPDSQRIETEVFYLYTNVLFHCAGPFSQCLGRRASNIFLCVHGFTFSSLVLFRFYGCCSRVTEFSFFSRELAYIIALLLFLFFGCEGS